VSYCDLVIRGHLLTMDEAQPTAEAIGVSDGRIVFVGNAADVLDIIGPATRVVDHPGGAVLPGFIEAHGHPVNEAIVLGGFIDIRPVTVPTATEVLSVIAQAVAVGDPAGVYLNGWDPLLQVGLPQPTKAWLDELAPDKPLLIVHNSGHSAYFNDALARLVGIDRDTPDPVGSRFGRSDDGELDGSAFESAALFRLAGPGFALTPQTFAERMRAESARLNAVGVTMCSEMAWDPILRGHLDAAVDTAAVSVRLRLYEKSGPQLSSASEPGAGDDLIRQIGIKTWADGSPWVGNIATSFGYLDTDSTRGMGLPPDHHGHANYTRDQVDAIGAAYFPSGWQLSCHVHGDLAVDMMLDAWQQLLETHPRPDHRLRLEHVGAMTPAQFQRAADLGVTVSLLINHIYYWGDVLVDGLFGPDHGSQWAAARSALDAGLRISLHNDAPVTPTDPLRNISVAATRATRSGRVLAPQQRITVNEGLRAQTIDAAYQCFAEDIVGSLEVGKYADLVLLDADPTTTDAGQIADIGVVATYLAGRCVYARV
jgi:predicted amidohydrolase YtcJ